MADNFNMKKFLVENKLGAYSKLKENESSDLEVKWTKKYTKDPDLYYEKGLASEFEMVNGKKVKEIIGYFEDEDEDEDEEVIGYIYSKSNKDIETEYSEEDLDDVFTKALGSMNEGEAAYEYEKGKAAGEKEEEEKLKEGKDDRDSLMSKLFAIQKKYGYKKARPDQEEYENVRISPNVARVGNKIIEDGGIGVSIENKVSRAAFADIKNLIQTKFPGWKIDPQSVTKDDDFDTDSKNVLFFDIIKNKSVKEDMGKDIEDAEAAKMMDFLAEKPVEEAGQGTLMAVDRIEEIVNNLARNISTNSNIPTQEKLGLVQALKELKDLVEDLGADVEMGMSETKKEEGYMGTQYDSSEDMAVDMVKKGITEASGGLSPLHKQLIQNIVDNYFDGGIYADPAMERIERILNNDLSWEELDNEDLEDLKEDKYDIDAQSFGGVLKSDNPEGDALVLRFLKGIAKKFDYPVGQAALFVKERIKKLGY